MVAEARPVTVTAEPVLLYMQYQPVVPIGEPDPKTVLALYVVLFTGAGVPLLPAFIKTIRLSPFPLVQFTVV